MKARHDPRREQNSPCHQEKNELDVPSVARRNANGQNTTQRVSQNTTFTEIGRAALYLGESRIRGMESVPTTAKGGKPTRKFLLLRASTSTGTPPLTRENGRYRRCR